ncbi:hypothetical protein ACFQZI_06875 [Mucilaginibacter lutimaris]|uniref:Uncharacterized protein n=1 Tax=Mucilaginibacter lutimaris TaxID=931629 RepID=A0ABW2ZEG0_9SPHI
METAISTPESNLIPNANPAETKPAIPAESASKVPGRNPADWHCRDLNLVHLLKGHGLGFFLYAQELLMTIYR